MKFSVRYNHVGYAPKGPKVFLLACDVADNPLKGMQPWFEVYTERGERVFGASMAEKGACSYTDEFVWEGDFSEIARDGNYRIAVMDAKGNILAESKFFEVSDRLALEQLSLTLKSFYFQRCGVELTPDRAGKWARPAAHLDDNIEFHPSMERAGTWNAHGGWYDAGDYGKYIVNGGVSLATLLLAAEFADDRPMVSSNADFFDVGSFRSNLLEEIRFELEFFLRMQDEDGGVFFKVSPVRWDGFVSPSQSDALQKRQILGKSTTSTLNFAGALAQAHRVFARAYPGFAKQCLDAALRAYRWAVENPDVTYPHNTEGSGGYGDERYDDEFFWARAMLYREGQVAGADLKELLLRDMEKCPPDLGMSWRDTQNLGWIALALQSQDPDLQVRARNTLKGVADKIVKLAGEDPYGLSIRKFVWGSNGEIANHALTLFLVDEWFPSKVYADCARRMLDFIFGKNPVDRCFVTGSAWSSPKFIHHRISHSDGIEAPIPGLLAGGINADRQDLHRFPHYPGPQPGFSYTDERCSFASNETAINWNAPLVAALSFCC
ncbi:endoglucanase [Fibrobacter sp. UWR3]|uniref:glycoside hydrolase family 9 protein n=1 Tax=Fibrobacter sp. UWR3 TaxID=1896217 RepID=UPI00090F3131|nr:glycoside hydrolase family 9 protein [Fibrobacter sp. UWR3]SHM65448.1 endoglucanase [Fibrobacter sp. UWR3]